MLLLFIVLAGDQFSKIMNCTMYRAHIFDTVSQHQPCLVGVFSTGITFIRLTIFSLFRCGHSSQATAFF